MVNNESWFCVRWTQPTTKLFAQQERYESVYAYVGECRARQAQFMHTQTHIIKTWEKITSPEGNEMHCRKCTPNIVGISLILHRLRTNHSYYSLSFNSFTWVYVKNMSFLLQISSIFEKKMKRKQQIRLYCGHDSATVICAYFFYWKIQMINFHFFSFHFSLFIII